MPAHVPLLHVHTYTPLHVSRLLQALAKACGCSPAALAALHLPGPPTTPEGGGGSGSAGAGGGGSSSEGPVQPSGAPPDVLHESHHPAEDPLERLLRGDVRCVEYCGQEVVVDAPRRRRVYLPGSFNPLHDGAAGRGAVQPVCAPWAGCACMSVCALGLWAEVDREGGGPLGVRRPPRSASPGRRAGRERGVGGGEGCCGDVRASQLVLLATTWAPTCQRRRRLGLGAPRLDAPHPLAPLRTCCGCNCNCQCNTPTGHKQLLAAACQAAGPDWEGAFELTVQNADKVGDAGYAGD